RFQVIGIQPVDRQHAHLVEVDRTTTADQRLPPSGRGVFGGRADIPVGRNAALDYHGGRARCACPEVTHLDRHRIPGIARRDPDFARAALAGEPCVHAGNARRLLHERLGGFGCDGKTHGVSPCNARGSSHAENRKRPSNPAVAGFRDSSLGRRIAPPQELAPCGTLRSRGLPRLPRACPSAGLDEQWAQSSNVDCACQQTYRHLYRHIETIIWRPNMPHVPRATGTGRKRPRLHALDKSIMCIYTYLACHPTQTCSKPPAACAWRYGARRARSPGNSTRPCACMACVPPSSRCCPRCISGDRDPSEILPRCCPPTAPR